MTRAVVVDDSHFMRTVITDTLTDGGIEVVAQAGDGAEAVRTVADCRPDVVTMDYRMPGMTGLEAVERIMAEEPTPILMLSAHTDDGDDVTFEALDRGAVDFFTKPGGEISAEMSRYADQLVRKVREVARADVTCLRDAPVEPSAPASGDVAGGERLTVVIGSSTGGPGVVEHVLSALPATGVRVLVVQHMPDQFTGRFADRLDATTDFEVWEANDGDRVGDGQAVVAPGDNHLLVSGYASGRLRVESSDAPPVDGIRPAADLTMRSAAEAVDDPLVGVVLTGMGHDGAEGIEAIRNAGGTTVVQDEETSAVFGMPREAIATGCVDEVRPAGEIPDTIRRATGGVNR